jgi:hypothetical protein
MALITSQPTANQTPDPALGGGIVTGIINTGHGSTNTTSAVLVGAGGSDSDADTKSARWSSFQTVGGQIADIRLKFNWSINGGATASADNLDGGNASSDASFAIQYSINGGSSWITALVRNVSASDPGDPSNLINDSGSVDISLGAGQAINLVQVRALMDTSADASAGPSSSADADASITTTVSLIRLEVTTSDGQVIVIM